MTLREFITEANELCSGNLDTEILLYDYQEIELDHDGEDLIIRAITDTDDDDGE